MKTIITKPIAELTIEEAVENLKYLLECNYVDSFEETEKEAIKMGIEALNHYGGNSINNYRKLSNKEMIDFLVKQFDISRTSAKDMLHVMMSVKREDNFKKLFNKCRKEVRYENNKET